MKQILCAFVLVLCCSQAWAKQQIQPIQYCLAHLPYGLPVDSSAVQICRKGYVVHYDLFAKIPKLVAYKVSKDTVLGCEPRESNFAQDQSMASEYRATTRDFADSGYDIGHMADAAGQSYSEQSLKESFIFSNTVPQVPSFNRGIWKQLETKIRAWANSGRNLNVYTGAIYNETSAVIGSGVVVPDKLYKIIVDTDSEEVLAFLFNNEPLEEKPLTDYMVTISEIELASGIEFNIPRIKNSVLNIWPADSESLARDKWAACHLH